MGAIDGGTLITGATGFLGPWLVEACARSAGAPVWAAARRPERLGDLTSAACEPVALDLGRVGAGGELVARLRPARIVHLAAVAAPAACDADPAAAERVNAEAPGELASAARGVGARFVHVSTDLVFGVEAAPPEGFDEDAPPAPIGAYGSSKLAGERAVREADDGAAIVRLPLLYGDSRGRGLGASDGLLEALGRGGFTLFEDEWRTPLEVGAAAQALWEVALGTHRGTLHLAGPERVSRLELGRAVVAAAGAAADGLPAPLASTRAAAGQSHRAADTSLDARRARALLDSPLPGLAEGLARWSATRCA